jgi:23S rRNA (guanosine2251-2'-O)-methyltransferase
MSARSGGGRTIAGRRAVTEALRAGIVERVAIAQGARRTAGMQELLDAARSAGVPVHDVERSALDVRAHDHQGVVAYATTPARPLGERELSTIALPDDAVAVVLDGIEDPQNLGAAVRAAEAAGASIVVTRTRRSAPVTDAAVRASAGALVHLPLARVANIPRAMDRLRERGFTIVGLDGERGESVFAGPAPAGALALVVGSEGRGMSRLARERCDRLVALPMRGHVGSLNAAAALAAVLWSYVLPGRSG